MDRARETGRERGGLVRQGRKIDPGGRKNEYLNVRTHTHTDTSTCLQDIFIQHVIVLQMLDFGYLRSFCRYQQIYLVILLLGSIVLKLR